MILSQTVPISFLTPQKRTFANSAMLVLCYMQTVVDEFSSNFSGLALGHGTVDYLCADNKIGGWQTEDFLPKYEK